MLVDPSDWIDRDFSVKQLGWIGFHIPPRFKGVTPIVGGPDEPICHDFLTLESLAQNALPKGLQLLYLPSLMVHLLGLLGCSCLELVLSTRTTANELQ